MEMTVGDIVKTFDARFPGLTGLIVDVVSTGIDSVGPFRSPWTVATVMVDGRIEEWKFGGNSEAPARIDIRQRWCRGVPQIVSTKSL